MSLKDIYDNWKFNTGNSLGPNKGPREQSDGKVAVDFLPNTYQKEVRNRAPGSTEVVQATADDATAGTFNVESSGQTILSAFKRYTALVTNSKWTYWHGNKVHNYNAQGTNPNDKYLTSTSVKDAPGVTYHTNN